MKTSNAITTYKFTRYEFDNALETKGKAVNTMIFKLNENPDDYDHFTIKDELETFFFEPDEPNILQLPDLESLIECCEDGTIPTSNIVLSYLKTEVEIYNKEKQLNPEKHIEWTLDY